MYSCHTTAVRVLWISQCVPQSSLMFFSFLAAVLDVRVILTWDIHGCLNKFDASTCLDSLMLVLTYLTLQMASGPLVKFNSNSSKSLKWLYTVVHAEEFNWKIANIQLRSLDWLQIFCWELASNLHYLQVAECLSRTFSHLSVFLSYLAYLLFFPWAAVLCKCRLLASLYS